jgi:2-polyprenyl-6-methoxyphenol hydroxylase-like FAD-dependent oxidoreductase
MKSQSVLISGMGVAGLTLAYFLKQYGFTPILIERAANLRIGGFKVDIRGVAFEVVKRMQILETLREKHATVNRAREIDANGDVLNEVKGSVFNALSGDDFEILRGTLCETILSKSGDIECHYKSDIAHAEQNSQGVFVEFDQGNNRRCDLLVGADGLHSNVRRLIFGEEKKYFKDLGLYISIYSMPNILGLDQEELLFELPDRFVNVYNARQSDCLRVALVFNANKLNVSYKDITAQKNAIHSVYAHSGWRTEELLSYMDKAEDFYFDNVAQIHMTQWSSDRVVLLGDAGYCGSPLSGQGTTLALVGSYILASELHKSDGDYLQAFSRYEERLRPFVEANQTLGKYTADSLLTGAGNSFEFEKRQKMFADASNAIKL